MICWDVVPQLVRRSWAVPSTPATPESWGTRQWGQWQRITWGTRKSWPQCFSLGGTDVQHPAKGSQTCSEIVVSTEGWPSSLPGLIMMWLWMPLMSRHLGETCSDHRNWGPTFTLCVFMCLAYLPVFRASFALSPPPGQEIFFYRGWGHSWCVINILIVGFNYVDITFGQASFFI